MPDFELFIFDFDGTLADSRLSISKSINHALRQFSLAEVEPAQIYPFIGKLMMDETLLRLHPTITVEQMPEILDAFRQYQRENVKTDLVYFPEVRETLNELRARGKQLAILSNKGQKQLEHGLAAFEFLELFDVVLGSGVLKVNKPDKACVEHIWQTLPTLPAQTVMIGDSEVDVLTAQNAGIPMIAVGHGTDSAETLLSLGANYAIEGFSELLNYT